MQPGFDPHSTGPDRGGPTSPGAVVYNSQYRGILKSALERARAGILTADWRCHLPEPAGIFTTSERFRDANTMAAQALNDMALQPWEPGQASNWRVALDSWFAAARHTLACEYTAFAQTQLRTLMDGERALSTLTSHIGIPGFVLDAAQRPWNLIAGDVITTGDRVLRDQMATYVIQRDWLTASYLAGLTAGGTPCARLARLDHHQGPRLDRHERPATPARGHRDPRAPRATPHRNPAALLAPHPAAGAPIKIGVKTLEFGQHLESS